MQTPIGTRVLAILETTEDTVRYFGEGTYVGRFPVPPEAMGINFGQESACIDLDDGGQVWGCECWWGPVAELRDRLSPGRTWEKIDIHQHRGVHRPAPTCPYCDQPIGYTDDGEPMYSTQQIAECLGIPVDEVNRIMIEELGMTPDDQPTVHRRH